MALALYSLSEDLQKRIREDRAAHWENPRRFCEEGVSRREDRPGDIASLWRPAFVRDIEKIMHLPLYNRYADKTQVFSFYENDDITRRALHVQLVSRIARNIGAVLGLNLDLIEAISLGHDIGHTPFGHAGERFLDELLCEHTGRHFCHNVHSVRVLDSLFRRNLSLQTLDGILCHNGEFEQQCYRPAPLSGFEEFDSRVEACYREGETAVQRLIPSTLEGCVVRLCDMIAYLGKDRQDARRARMIDSDTEFSTQEIGTENAAIINNMTVDILENSYGKDHISLSPGTYEDLKTAKRENNEKIYADRKVKQTYEDDIRPMFRELYEKLLKDLSEGKKASPVYCHHISEVRGQLQYYKDYDYLSESHNQIVVDYIASMTDDYFISLHRFLFPKSRYRVRYHSYFEDLKA